MIGSRINAKGIVAPKSFSLPESVLDKSKARFRRLQNSPEAQTVVIADLTLRQDLLAKTLSMVAQLDIFGATINILTIDVN
jgi:hypothetical protein